MGQEKEAVYLINGDKYLHLRENGAGVGFATYKRFTGEPLESGQISKQNLPPDGRNSIPAARNWYLFELSSDERKAIQLESVQILENIPQAGIGRRRIWEPETIPPDIRLIPEKRFIFTMALSIYCASNCWTMYIKPVSHLGDAANDLHPAGRVSSGDAVL